MPVVLYLYIIIAVHSKKMQKIRNIPTAKLYVNFYVHSDVKTDVKSDVKFYVKSDVKIRRIFLRKKI